MLSFGRNELGNNRRVKSGDTVKHSCGEEHVLMPALSNGEPDENLLWFTCEGKTFIAAVNGQLTFVEEE